MIIKKWVIAVVAILTLNQVVSADVCRSQDHGLTCCDCDYAEGWNVYADWLHWKSDIPVPDYAASIKDDHHVINSLELDYDSGIRLGVRVDMCGCYYFGAEYTGYSTDPEGSVTKKLNITKVQNILIDDTVPILADSQIKEAKGNYNLAFTQVNVEVGRDWRPSRCFTVQGFSGFRWANVESKITGVYKGEEINESINVDVIEKKNDFDFYGIYLGSRANYSIFECLGVFGELSFGLGSTAFDRVYSHFKGPVDVDKIDVFNKKNLVDPGGKPFPNNEYPKSKDDNSWGTVSVIDLQGGIFFRLRNCLSAEWDFCVGYEYHNWMNTLDFFDYKDGVDSKDVERKKQDLGFCGLFIRLSASF